MEYAILGSILPTEDDRAMVGENQNQVTPNLSLPFQVWLLFRYELPSIHEYYRSRDYEGFFWPPSGEGRHLAILTGSDIVQRNSIRRLGKISISEGSRHWAIRLLQLLLLD